MSGIEASGITGLSDAKLEALVEMMYLAAAADGEFSAVERQQFVTNLETLTDGRLTRDRLQQHCRAAAVVAGEPDARGQLFGLLEVAFQQLRQLRMFHRHEALVAMAGRGVLDRDREDRIDEVGEVGQGKLLDNATIGAIAAKHGRTPAQVIIRWHIDSGFVVIPKSITPSRIVENFQVFDFKLDADDIAAIAALDNAGARIGPDPKTATF